MHTLPPGRRAPPKAGPRTLLRAMWARAASAVIRLVPPILSVTPGDDPHAQSSRAAIYVSYDRWSIVADYVVSQVAALASVGRRVIFITNSPKISAKDAARLRPYVREIVHRRNFGHDFGAFKDGIARLGALNAIESLVLMNDSCYGPFGGLARIEQAAAASGTDLFGITDSWSIRYHLQTYFVWISGRAVCSPAFAAFWRGLLSAQPRSMVINNGEVMFTQKLLRAGLTVGALCPYSMVAARAQEAAEARLTNEADLSDFERHHLRRLVDSVLAGADLNPTHSFWDVLLTDCDSPFVKRDLLRRNPVRIPGVAQWEKLLADRPAVELDAIRQHLKLD